MIKLKQILTEITCDAAYDALGAVSKVTVTNRLLGDTYELSNIDRIWSGYCSNDDTTFTDKETKAAMISIDKISYVPKKSAQTGNDEVETDSYLGNVKSITIGVSNDRRANSKGSWIQYEITNKDGVVNKSDQEFIKWSVYNNPNVYVDTIFSTLLQWIVYFNSADDYSGDMSKVYKYILTKDLNRVANAKKTQNLRTAPAKKRANSDKSKKSYDQISRDAGGGSYYHAGKI